MEKITASIRKHIDEMKASFHEDGKLCAMYENTIQNTFLTTLKPKENERTFVITGDIPAMWLRDSTAQVRPLLLFAKQDPVIHRLLEGVLRTQYEQILTDPYANAFNEGPTGAGHQQDRTDMKPELWERKYEVDSLCYPIQLSYLLWKSTGDTSHFDEQFEKVCKTILEVFHIEQHHMERSSYRFERLEIESHCSFEYETLKNDGLGTPVAYTGMTWSGFRPSDDACRYGYLIPSNMFAVVVLRYIVEIAGTVMNHLELAKQAAKLAEEIDDGIQRFGIIDDPEFGQVYAYEVNGLGGFHFMDDANVPSLMAIPYFGYANVHDPIYQNTRKMLLSSANPFYFEGKAARGIGSPHTPHGYIWHIALAVQGMTSTDEKEQAVLLELLKGTDAGTNLMHEGFDADDPERFTRPWFSWANSMFAEFVLMLHGKTVAGTPLARD